MDGPDLKFVDEAIARIGRESRALIPLLQALQEHYRYLPPECLARVCEKTEIAPADVAGVSTFYDQFRLHPVGKHIISVCHGTACHVKGSQQVHDALSRHLGLDDGQDTDADGLFTIQKVACLGCCTLAPVLQIDGVTYGHLAPDTVAQALDDFLASKDGRAGEQEKGLSADMGADAAEIRITLDSCCVAGGSAKVHDALRRAVAETGVPAVVKRVGCIGMCHHVPLVEVALPGQEPSLYSKVEPEDARSIVLRHFRPRGIWRKAREAALRAVGTLLTDETWRGVRHYAIDVRDKPVADFLSRQKHIAIEDCARLDPTDLDEYIARGGFEALRRVVGEMSPAEVIDQIDAGGLRGRGGAGFPTGPKWRRVRDAPGGVKHIICNGDEGDPGAFMDRMILESLPYRVIEGMAIAARAVGADQGYLYIRAEYPVAVRSVREAISKCLERGLLGDGILGSEFRLNLEIMEGAGAFVCGEETALISSIEGRRGMPHLRPPYPAERGLWGRPTLVNNVETYAVVPWIIRRGPEAFAAMGTETSKGTKVFALAGKVARGGLIEVPMGITIRQIVDDIGGGIAGGGRFKAVQIGGPSGGCLPASLADTPVDFEALTSVGAMMGSGGLVVLDESDCMVDITRYFLKFTQDQSCGRCTFCRIGTRRMLDIVERLCAGQGRKGDIEALEQLATQVKRASLCGLGKTAPNPVLSTLKYFRDEYEAHIEGRCPAGRCAAMITYSITDDCIGCTLCSRHCPADAIPMTPYQQHEIDPDKCIRCGTCRNVCPTDAIRID